MDCWDVSSVSPGAPSEEHDEYTGLEAECLLAPLLLDASESEEPDEHEVSEEEYHLPPLLDDTGLRHVCACPVYQDDDTHLRLSRPSATSILQKYFDKSSDVKVVWIPPTPDLADELSRVCSEGSVSEESSTVFTSSSSVLCRSAPYEGSLELAPRRGVAHFQEARARHPASETAFTTNTFDDYYLFSRLMMRPEVMRREPLRGRARLSEAESLVPLAESTSAWFTDTLWTFDASGARSQTNGGYGVACSEGMSRESATEPTVDDSAHRAEVTVPVEGDALG
jgi:hypothetical protein